MNVAALADLRHQILALPLDHRALLCDRLGHIVFKDHILHQEDRNHTDQNEYNKNSGLQTFKISQCLCLNAGNNNPLPTLYVRISARSDLPRSSHANGGCEHLLYARLPDTHTPTQCSEDSLCCILYSG